MKTTKITENSCTKTMVLMLMIVVCNRNGLIVTYIRTYLVTVIGVFQSVSKIFYQLSVIPLYCRLCLSPYTHFENMLSKIILNIQVIKP